MAVRDQNPLTELYPHCPWTARKSKKELIKQDDRANIEGEKGRSFSCSS